MADPAETTVPVHLGYFPSVYHAAVFRNWDIVPLEELARVLETTSGAVLDGGAQLGLKPPPALTPEAQRRNYETVLRRNWPVMPRAQIESLLNWKPADLDHFLATDIAFRVLLGAPPPDLAPVKYEAPTSTTLARCDWFRQQVEKHRAAVADVKEEARFAFIDELLKPHKDGERDLAVVARANDADLTKGWTLLIPPDAGPVCLTFAEDFAEYCRTVQGVENLSITTATAGQVAAQRTIQLTVSKAVEAKDESYRLEIGPQRIEIAGATDRALARALIELEHRMGERGGPFLAPTNGVETHTPSFSPRYVYPYFAPMTDVLGQDVIDPCPPGYLNTVAHQDADGIWLFCVLEDMVPSPVFEGMGVRSEQRRERLRSIIARAAKYGLKVFLYFNEPRPKPHGFFEKYPAVRGRNEGELAALCTSTDEVRRHLRGSFEQLFREVPGIGGVFIITGSENLTHCYAHGMNIDCERCKQRRPEEVVAELVRDTTAGVRASGSKAPVIVWDWSWHNIGIKDPQQEIVDALKPEAALMADFERGTEIKRGGVPMTVDEYSISVVGPSPRAAMRSKQAEKLGVPFLAKIQLSSTWECGTVPFIPVPGLLAEKAKAMRAAGVDGCMQSWTLGSYPSPNAAAFAVQQWNPDLSTTDVLRRVAARRYGDAATSTAVQAWTKFGQVFNEEYPFSVAIYTGPIQYAPGLPWFSTAIPKPYGNGAMLNPKDDWKIWTAPYSAPQMAAQMRHMCDRWSDSLSDMKQVVELAAGARRRTAELDYGVAWIIDYTYRNFANALDFYQARERGDVGEMRRLAQVELGATAQAYRHVLQDSRLGWEAQLQYYYQPSDVLERLVSLEGILAE